MKRVLIFSLAYYPKHVGGAEVAIKEITDRIERKDIEFHMITNRYDSSLARCEQVGNVLVHRIGFSRAGASFSDLQTFPLYLNKGMYQFLAFVHALRLHARYRYQGIWAMMAHATGVPAGLFKTLYRNIPYILTLQEGDPPPYIEKRMSSFGPLFRRAFSRADVLQPISNFLEQWGRRMGFSGISVVIPNGVALAHFSASPSPRAVAAFRERMCAQAGVTYVVTTSRLVHKNGIDSVIRALPLLPPAIHFVIYGIGPDEAMLRSLADELTVAPRVHFLGHIEHTDMPAALRACNIFIRASRSEGMGNSFIEAMAVGLPVVGTEVGGIPDFLKDNETGFLVQPDDAFSIADGIMRALGDAREVQRVCDTARSMVTKRYDWEKIVSDMQGQVFSHIKEANV